MKFRATAEELAKTKLVTPGWHPVEVKTVQEKTDKDGAGLLVVHGLVIGGKEQDKGALLRAQFSEKAPAMIKNFVESVIPGEEFKADKDYDLKESTLKGKKLEFYVERDTYKGRPTNNVVDYRPLQSA